MKIGFLIRNLENGGGTERVTSVLASRLAEDGYDTSIISCRDGLSCKYRLSDKIKLISLNGERESNFFVRKLKTYSNLKKVVSQQNLDILVVVDVGLFLYCKGLPASCKYIAWEHFNYYINKGILRRIARNYAVHNADCLVVLGKNDYNNYVTHYKNIQRIEYIYNASEMDFSSNADIDSHKMIAVGRLDYQKGFDMLIDAWGRIEKEIPDWSMEIYGEGSDKEELQSKIDNLHLQHIKLMGYSKNIKEKMLESSVFVLSSRYEGFVLVLIEALALALPIVSFDCKEGPAELIQNGENGFLIEPDNVEKLADGMQKLALDRDKRLLFASNARKGLDRFELDSVVEKWEKLFDTLVKEKQ